MRIERVTIKNFRCFPELDLPLNPYTCLVGANGSGKSTVLSALNIFFQEPSAKSSISKDDFSHKNTEDPIRITVTFGSLSKTEIQELSDYVRQNKLRVVCKVLWDDSAETAILSQFGERLVMSDFSPYFEKRKAKENKKEIQEVYDELAYKYGLAPAKAYTDMENNLREYEEAHPKKCEPRESGDQFYGFTKGKNKLDPFLQWVYVPAVKHASDESSETKNTAISRLVERAVRMNVNFGPDISLLRRNMEERYKSLIQDHQSALESLERSLSERLTRWSHPGAGVHLSWSYNREKDLRIEEPKVAVDAKESGFQGDVSKFGHGLQRSYLLAVLQELANQGDESSDSPTLILACEEPELYQHPPQARYLAHVFRRLSKSESSQVLITTHSPYFVQADNIEEICVVTNKGSAKCNQVTTEDLSNKIGECLGDNPGSSKTLRAKLQQILRPQLSELFFAPRIVLVEGPEDIAYIRSYIELLDLTESFRKQGIHLVPAFGKPLMLRPLLIGKMFGISVYPIFDADKNDKENKSENTKQNLALMKAAGMATTSPFPEDPQVLPQGAVWPSSLGDTVREEIGEHCWSQATSKVTAEYGGEQKKLRKTGLWVSDLMVECWDAGAHSESLRELCHKIVSF